MTPPNPPPECRWETGPAGAVLRLAGDWRTERGVPDPAATLAEAGWTSGGTVIVQADRIAAWDTALSGFLAGFIEEVEKQGGRVELRGLPDGVSRLLALARAVPEAEPPPAPPALTPWRWLADKAQAAWTAVVDVLAFLGELTIGLGRLLRGRARTRAA
ncbi:MAG: STAS domain-containing protein, partial [Verrucomicrobia bacterium]